ncbi:sensor domain-containing protein [Cellulomonas iranensis]|uniref:sensor histidine kinase n=1 Tax=Cellulomonas iranensis TaxID=76862 RepID=UPI001CF3EB57|nr:sensor domain-containing protein [Cellulomonas iranensis]UCN15207.1 sensor domain-containing protein [Cellulomonas iranensis]
MTSGPVTAPPRAGRSTPSSTALRDPSDHVPAAVDVQHVAPALRGGRALLLAPVSAATWSGAGQLAVSTLFTVLGAILLITGVAVGVGTALVVVGVPVLLGTLALARVYGRVERTRLAAQLGVVVPPPSPAPAGFGRRSWWPRARDDRAWLAVAHAAVTSVLTSVAVPLAASFAAVPWVLLATPFVDASRQPFDVIHVPAYVAVPVAVVLPWVSALVVQLTTLAQVRLGRALLGGRSRADVERAAREAETRANAAEGRAEHLRETRSAAVDAADDERRRIERDLHDGAQQRLVALGVELGVARRAAAHDPQAAVAAVDAAHGEIKEVLAELRDLVRGVHPAVLTDRGLDAALSALAARSPVPVDVETRGLEPGMCVQAQAAAYFVVAEALTNVAKHAHAAQVVVRATVAGDRLRVEVADDGRGGATAAPGGGLDGLRRRVEALDGAFLLLSPATGGTVLTVEVPCAS